MKRQTISLFVFTILASSIFFSCNEKKLKQYGNMEFDSIKVNNIAYLVNDTASPNCSLTINYQYPVKSLNQILLDSVNIALTESCFGKEYVHLTAQASIDSFTNTYIRDYKKDLQPLYLEDLKNNKGDQSVGGWYSYYQNIEARPLSGSSLYLTYEINQSEFRGGAHGAYSTTYLNFNANNGHIMHLSDLFKAGYEKGLSDLLLNKLMKDTGSSTLEELENKAYLQDTEMYPTENFRLDTDHITFFYNVYEIAPYSSGTTQITLSYDQLKELMKEQNEK